MSYLKIYRNDFKVLLGVAAIMPVACFVGGYYTGAANQPQQTETLLAQPIADHTATVADRSASRDQIAMLNGNGMADGLSFRESLPEQAESIQSEIVALRDEGNNTADDLAASTEIPDGLPTVGRQAETAVLTSKANTVTDPALLSLTSLQSFNDYLVQAGCFSSYDNATKLQAQLAEKHIPAKITLNESTGQSEYLIIVNSFSTREEAKQYCRFAEKFHQLDCFVKTGEHAPEHAKETFASL